MYLTVSEYAAYYKISKRTVYNLCARGVLRYKISSTGAGRKIRLIDASDYVKHPPALSVGNPNFFNSDYQRNNSRLRWASK